MKDKLTVLFESYTGEEAVSSEELFASGSNRRYFRIQSSRTSLIGVIGTNIDENRAFIALARHFGSRGINVPRVCAVSEDGMLYLQEDLGTEVLYNMISKGREEGSYSPEERGLLRQTMRMLPKVQFEGAVGLDFSVCFPEPAFNDRMVLFDLNYFKYCFLKATGLDFDEIRLQEDFERLREDLMKDMGNTFMYRDFQARNVMYKSGKPYFIDFQGGRRGPIYYDVASFIWQARSRYPEDLKEELIEAYLDALKEYQPDVDEAVFRSKLRLFVLFRTLQVLGAYGFRGYFEKKPHFMASVPFAIANIRRLIRDPFEDYPYLSEVLTRLTQMHQFYELAGDNRLEVSIFSFAFKKGVPPDTSGNGGGYVFDLRALNNPGKYEHYRQFTGLDEEVVKFIEDDGGAQDYLEHVYAVVDDHVRTFIRRKFTHLQVCFGCTGGQHRSVYCAERLAEHLAAKFDVKISITHRELGIEKLL